MVLMVWTELMVLDWQLDDSEGLVSKFPHGLELHPKVMSPVEHDDHY